LNYFASRSGRSRAHSLGSVPTPLDRVRELCLALPEVTDRPSHGSPAWFIRGRHRGWVGVHLNRGLDWNEIAGAIEEAVLVVAPKRLAEEAIRARG
jgi:hypothetical protein